MTQGQQVAVQRQFGLDWLRIGAFGLLIFYHIGMFFVPWSWHVKTSQPVDWIQWPMLAVNPWRLSLLFVISGIVSRFMLAKLARSSDFARSRSLRLLIPLAAGMAIFVVPQPWVELRDQGVYSESLAHFWLNDYGEFGASRGTPLPTWNHLWFVAYLWAYSMLLALAAALPQGVRVAFQGGFNRLFAGWKLFLLPIAWLTAARLLLFPQFGETHALVDDPYAHAIYGFAFFFGVGLARADAAWAAMAGNWKLALAAAAVGFGMMVQIRISGLEGELVMAAQAAARALLAWGAIVGLLGVAQTGLNCERPIRRYLTEAIFPYYIVHQSIIILVGYQLKPLALGPGLEFAIILAATLLGCALAFEIARRMNWLRPLLGLGSRRAAAPQPGFVLRRV